MAPEYAIICTHDNGALSVHYVSGSSEKALSEALDSYRCVPCACITIARVCGYVLDESTFGID